MLDTRITSAAAVSWFRAVESLAHRLTACRLQLHDSQSNADFFRRSASVAFTYDCSKCTFEVNSDVLLCIDCMIHHMLCECSWCMPLMNRCESRCAVLARLHYAIASLEERRQAVCCWLLCHDASRVTSSGLSVCVIHLTLETCQQRVTHRTRHRSRPAAHFSLLKPQSQETSEGIILANGKLLQAT